MSSILDHVGGLVSDMILNHIEWTEYQCFDCHFKEKNTSYPVCPKCGSKSVYVIYYRSKIEYYGHRIGG